MAQHRKNASFGDYIGFSASQFRNFVLSISVGVIGVMQFVLQKAGEPLMGDFRYISFAVLMSSAVFFSAILGVLLGEWKGTSRRTRILLGAGIAILASGFAVMASGGSPVAAAAVRTVIPTPAKIVLTGEAPDDRRLPGLGPGRVDDGRLSASRGGEHA